MTINLMNLLTSFEAANDFENNVAFFRTHVPWVGSEAYLHTVFKPAPKDALSIFAEKLKMPPIMVQFLQHQNGAMLFSGALYFYGVVAPGQLLNRSDPYSLPAFNIADVNSRTAAFDINQLLAVGGYGFDGADVCIDRKDGSIKVFPPKSATPTASWPDFEYWIRSEIARLTVLFDSNGRRLVDESATVPPTQSRVQ